MNAIVNTNQAMNELRETYNTLTEENPKLRIRDAATKLGVSECELVAATLSSDSFILDQNYDSLLKGLKTVGSVMCLTRNETAVHERHGEFEQVSVNGKMGLVLGPDIDLRLFLGRWKTGFYLNQALQSGQRKSLQFFDASGTAIVKIYATDASDINAFDALAKDHKNADQQPSIEISSAKCPVAQTADAQVDTDKLRDAWSALRDTHEFFGMLHKLKLNREQALRLVGSDFATAVPTQTIPALLENACAAQVPIMVFVSNAGCIQIHTGEIKTYKKMGDWLNILDPIFNLHLRSERFKSVWLVRKPSDDGVITSLEVFDENDDMVVQFFGARKPGIPEREDWRELLSKLQMKDAA